MVYHIGRSWSGTKLEDDCPCEKAPCGLAISEDDSCPEHSPFAIKTIRQMHTEEDCPGEKMIDPKLCSEYNTYYGFVAGLERKLVRAEPWLDEPWVYEDNNGVRHSVSDRNVSHLSTRPRFLIEPEPDVESELEQENQKLHNEWMIEHIRANAAEDRVRQLEDFILGANFNRVPEPPSEVENGVYTWRGKYDVVTAPGKFVLIPGNVPRNLKAEEAEEFAINMYAAAQVSKGEK